MMSICAAQYGGNELHVALEPLKYDHISPATCRNSNILKILN